MIFLPELAVNVVSIARNYHSIKSSKKSQDISIISIKSKGIPLSPLSRWWRRVVS